MKTFGRSFLALALLAAQSPVLAQSAPTRDQCFDAHEKSQVSRKDKKLRAALDDLAICANASCPKLVRTECAAALAEIEKNLPTVRLSLKRADGSAVEGARVSIDGAAPIAVSNEPVRLDPGAHVFRFEHDGQTVENRVDLAEGQRDVNVAGELKAAVLETAPPAPPINDTPEPKPGVSPVVYVLGGVAVVGLIGFVGFGLAGKGAESDLDDCKPDCKKDDVDSMRQKYLFADISLGVALVAAGAGVYFYLKQPKKTEQAATWVRAAPSRSGGGMIFGTSF